MNYRFETPYFACVVGLLGGEAQPQEFLTIAKSQTRYVKFRNSMRWAFQGWQDCEANNSAKIGNFARLYFGLTLNFQEDNTIFTVNDWSCEPSEVECTPLMRAEVKTIAHELTGLVNRTSYLPLAPAPAKTWRKLSAGFLEVAEVRSWIALHHNRGGHAAEDEGEVAQLTITLFKTSGNTAGNNGALRLLLCPTLLTSLSFFSDEPTPDGQPGWWSTLDAARDWAVSQYDQACRNDDARAESALRGTYIARWHLDLNIWNETVDLDNGQRFQSPAITGPSHGAAFALCLAKALAIAHLAQAGQEIQSWPR